METVAKIIEKEKVEGVLSGMGGQTALNLCSELAEKGYLDRLNCRLYGTQPRAIALSEDRELFKETMIGINEPVPRSKTCHTLEEAREAVKYIGRYPVLIRPAYTLGGTGGGIAYNDDDLAPIVGRGLIYSRIKQVLIEESVIGWKELEYEVMRDRNDNCVIICSMENLDAMGIHTGESIVIAPVQTLNDVDHHRMRTAAIKIIRALGIEGGCNVQFAFDPATKDYRVIEVNPRVSRSSALASKATGYPIARVAAKIAIGKTLDEIPNKITGKTFAAFEPTIDYCVIKIPRWPFDKFRTVDRTLGTQMKSTGEVMAIGRSIEEGIMKAVRSLETDRIDLEPEPNWTDKKIEQELNVATDLRLFAIAEAIRRGMSIERIAQLTYWDEFFVHKVKNLVDVETRLKKEALTKELLKTAKGMGYPDESIAIHAKVPIEQVAEMRKKYGITPTYKMVDTCAAEFEAATPYYYSTYETESEGKRSTRKKVIIVGAGPIRIGQGIEFDYCCVHGVMACQEEDVDAIVINNNPETVSTDYDISDRLYFEPLILEDVRQRHREGGCGRGHRAVRWADVGQPGGAAGESAPRQEGQDTRHQPGHDRHGRGPEALDRADARTGYQAAGVRHRLLVQRGARRRQPHRLPGAAPAVLCSWRPGDGDHLLGGRAEDLRGDGGQGVPLTPGADRQIPLTRHRDRR